MPINDRCFKLLTARNVGRSPRKQGVYALYDHRKLVFLGQAEGEDETIRSRLRGHLGTVTKGVLRYKREPSKSPAARLKQLLGEYVERHGREPALNRTS